MNEIPMSKRDEIGYNKRDFNSISMWKHIPKDYLDDPDPKCDFSMITYMGALSKEGLYFSEISSRLSNGGLEKLVKLAGTF